jgi:hypothetical protein
MKTSVRMVVNGNIQRKVLKCHVMGLLAEMLDQHDDCPNDCPGQGEGDEDTKKPQNTNHEETPFDEFLG